MIRSCLTAMLGASLLIALPASAPARMNFLPSMIRIRKECGSASKMASLAILLTLFGVPFGRPGLRGLAGTDSAPTGFPSVCTAPALAEMSLFSAEGHPAVRL